MTWPWGQMSKSLLPSSSTSEINHITCVTRFAYDFCIWWPFVTSAWPWPVLNMRVMLQQYLPLFIGRVLAEFGRAAFDSIVSTASNPETCGFDLWPDLDLWPWPLKENFKHALESSHWELSIAASRVSLRLLVRELDRGGRICPPQRGVFGWIPQRGAG